MSIDNVGVQQPVVLVYTMTDGLGDYLVMGDVMHKAKLLLPDVQCLRIDKEILGLNEDL